MNEHGRRTQAGKLLSQHLRQIGEEVTELIRDPETGEDRMATKMEALARNIWKDALGYKEFTIENGKSIDILHRPNRAAQGLILERTEGRAPMAITDKDSKLTAAERVSEQGKKRINNILE